MRKGVRNLLKNWNPCRKTVSFIMLMKADLMSFITVNTVMLRGAKRFMVKSAVKSSPEPALSQLNTGMSL